MPYCAETLRPAVRNWKDWLLLRRGTENGSLDKGEAPEDLTRGGVIARELWDVGTCKSPFMTALGPSIP